MKKAVIDSGKLDTQITIENYTTAISSTGEKLKTWNTYKTVFAAVNYKAGIEKYLAKKEHDIIKAEILIRYDSNLINANNYRIVIAAETFDIISIFEIGRKQAMKIIVSQSE